MKRKEKIVLNPQTRETDCDSVSSDVAIEEPRQCPDPKAVVGRMPEEPLGRLTRTGNLQKEPVPGSSAGGSPTEDLKDRPTEHQISSVVQIRGRAMELAGRIRGRAVSVLLDSGSTGNFISAAVARQHNMKIQKEREFEKLTLADGSIVRTEGIVNFWLTCGRYREQLTVRVFPNLHKQVILGMPWLSATDPDIKWSKRIVKVMQKGQIIRLPLMYEKEMGPEMAIANLISAKQAEQMLQESDQCAFLGIVRPVEDNQAEVAKEQSDLGVAQHRRENLPDCVRSVLKEYEDVFPEDLPPGLPPRRMGHEFKIDLTDDTPPVHRPLYKMSPLELAEAKKQIEYMMEHGYIRPSDSPFGAPVLFAPKKDGGLRFCIDYRWLNKRTIRNQYPLPLPEEMFDRLGGSTIFSKIDLRSGYWQMPMRKEDIPKTAFKTRWGLYEFLVVPFGVTNAPAQFMNLMNDVLKDYLNDFVVVFLDDILTYSKTPEDHAEHLRKVLEKLRQHRLYAKASKCQMAVQKIEFLGQMVSPKGMCPVDEKLRAVKEWGRPKSLKDVRSFLGFANYYRRYVRNFAEIANPLTMLTRKDVQWQWGPTQRMAFRQLKEALCTAPFLVYPDPKLPYTVVTDASGIAVGGVLMQDHGQGLQPLAFLSRQLKPSEQKYSAYERELSAVAYCFINWRHYIEGCPGGVTVVTDHKPLTNLMDQQQLTRAQMRWIRLGLFQSIKPQIKYQPGKANVVADALSRSKSDTEVKMDEPEIDAHANEMMINALLGGSQVKSAEVDEWRIAQREDSVL